MLPPPPETLTVSLMRLGLRVSRSGRRFAPRHGAGAADCAGCERRLKLSQVEFGIRARIATAHRTRRLGGDHRRWRRSHGRRFGGVGSARFGRRRLEERHKLVALRLRFSWRIVSSRSFSSSCRCFFVWAWAFCLSRSSRSSVLRAAFLGLALLHEALLPRGLDFALKLEHLLLLLADLDSVGRVLGQHLAQLDQALHVLARFGAVRAGALDLAPVILGQQLG